MVGAQVAVAAVEMGQFARTHIDGADRHAHVALLVQVIEVDQFFQGRRQRAGVIERGLFGRHLHAEGEAAEQARREEARHPAHDRVDRVPPDIGAPQFVFDQVHVHAVGMRDAVPELLDPRQPIGRCIAGNQGRVDGANRGAHDPVGHQIVLMQRLVDAGLVGAERAAALQHQHDAHLVGI